MTSPLSGLCSGSHLMGCKMEYYLGWMMVEWMAYQSDERLDEQKEILMVVMKDELKGLSWEKQMAVM